MLNDYAASVGHAAHSFTHARQVIDATVGRPFALQGLRQLNRADPDSVLLRKRLSEPIKPLVVIDPQADVPSVPATVALILRHIVLTFRPRTTRGPYAGSRATSRDAPGLGRSGGDVAGLFVARVALQLPRIPCFAVYMRAANASVFVAHDNIQNIR